VEALGDQPGQCRATAAQPRGGPGHLAGGQGHGGARPPAPASRLHGPHSHSIVPGGLLVTSRTTRLISGTSLVIREEIRASTSYGTRAQSAVMASSLDTGRSTMGWP